MIQALGFLLMRAATNMDGPDPASFSGEGCILSQFLRFASVGRIIKYGGERQVKNAEQIATTPISGDPRRGVAAATRCESSRLVTPSHLCILRTVQASHICHNVAIDLEYSYLALGLCLSNTMESNLAASTRHPS